jgi:membrane protein
VIRDGGWHRSVTGVARRTFQSAVEDNVPFLASALSFDLLLTFPPFALLLLGVVGYLVQQHVARADIALHDLIAQFLPAGAQFGGLETLLAQIVANRGRLTLLGAVLFVWFSTRAFGGLRAALNEVFDTEERRPWPLAKLLDLAMVLVTGALLVLNAYLSVLGVRGELERAGLTGWLWRFIVQLATVAFSTVLFLWVFKLMPSRRIPWRTALVAATFSAIAFEAAKRLFALYLVHFTTLDRLTSDANLLGVFLFLLWVYYTCFVFLLGGEVAETYDLVRRRRAQRVRLG